MIAFKSTRIRETLTILYFLTLRVDCIENLLEKYLQPDNVDSGSYDILQNSTYNLCLRPCVGKPKICYYRFTLEHYSTMGPACGLCPVKPEDCLLPECVTADGYERTILTVNRRLSGPSIQVCKGDTVIVEVKNKFLSESTSIHWHGVEQKGTPYMDGVPMVTQCPILPGQIFRYKFKVNKGGTYFWYSHSGFEKLDGIYGSLIVREPSYNEDNEKLYDFDLPSHVLLISDWMHSSSYENFPSFQTRDMGKQPDSYLINGKGFYSQKRFDILTLLDIMTTAKTPVATFNVSSSLKYRFRLIGGTSLSCPVEVIFEGHKQLVITVDGGNFIKPKLVDSVILFPGERFDIVINTNREPSSYWILVKGLGNCKIAHQVGILKYVESDLPRPPSLYPGYTGLLSRVTLNKPIALCDLDESNHICINQLQSKKPAPKEITEMPPHLRLLIAFGFNSYSTQMPLSNGTNVKYFDSSIPIIAEGLINNISNTLPPSPLLGQLHEVPNSLHCPLKCTNESNACHCLNLISVPFGSVVEIIIADTAPRSETGISHPFHLHGYEFFMLAEGILTGNFYEAILDLNKKLNIYKPEYNKFPPMRDTIAVPSGGYTVIRFKANNPGYWLMHSNFLSHLNMGMSAILEVGKRTDLPPLPLNFPKCGDYLPSTNSINHFLN